MARVIYVDSGFFIALIDHNDNASIQAIRSLDTYNADPQVDLVTTRDVLNEVLAHFSRSLPIWKRSAASFTKQLLDNPRYRVIVVDNAVYRQALNLYETRLDKRYSMVDCLGMTVMRSLDIDEVISTDRDFEQEGFNNLLRQTS